MASTARRQRSWYPDASASAAAAHRRAAVNSLRTSPGSIIVTLTPNGATSIRVASVRAPSAYLLALYIA